MKKDKLKFIVNKQNNSINGNFIYNDKKYFYKVLNKSDYQDELNGYKLAINKLHIKKMIYYNFLKDNKYVIIYEYEDTVEKNKGLLNDLLVKNDKEASININVINKMNDILSVYDINLKYTKILDYSANDRFFKGRIKNRLKKWYKDDNDFSKIIFINGKRCKSINMIIDEVVEYFEKENEKMCFFSQGDPNTLNISIKPCFFDLVTAGYNSIIGEFAIMFISTLFYDNYFCPKYHSKSYFLHEKALQQYILFESFIIINNMNSIEINCIYKSSNIRKEYVLRYINILKKNKICISSDVKYYIIMRLLCVFNIEEMEYNDYFYSIYLVEYFYYLFNKNDSNVLLIFENMLSNMEVV